jgi:hypothetical protein
VFERFNERARRVIFFGRYEASKFGSPYIQPEHLLLALLREDASLRNFLSLEKTEKIRKQVEESFPRGKKRISTSVDLPLSQESIQILSFASEGAHEDEIDCKHLLEGLLRTESSAAEILKRNGLDPESARVLPRPTPKAAQSLEARIAELPESPPEEPTAAVAPALQSVLLRFEGLITTAFRFLPGFTEVDAVRPLKRESWTRNEALGHLIDWATAHHNWFALALTEANVFGTAYPSRDLASAQQYSECEWRNLVDLWLRMNRLLVHVISKIPEGKTDIPCRIGLDQAIPLSQLVERYIEHSEDVMGQILVRG